MRATVVLNARSSQTARHAARIPDLLADRKIDVDSLELVADEAALRKALKRALKRGVECAIVGGGDGSMTTAADVFAKRDVTLGVLPLGTGNSFAMTLGIPDDLEKAIDVIASGHERRVDLGVMNGAHFANFVTIGLSAEIASAAPHELKPIIGPAAYVAGGLKPFAKHRPFVAKIRSDDGKMKIETHQIVVANGRFFGHQPIVPDATILNGTLALFTTTGLSHVDVARTYVAMAFGKHTQLPDAVWFTSRKIEIAAKPKQLVSVDGNDCGKTPLEFSVAPGALRVFVPSGFDGVRA